MTHAEKEVRNLEIVKMRHDGKSMSEIAELCGLTLSAIHCICKRYNVAGVMSDRKSVVENPKNQYTNGQFDREANAIRYINERTPNFEYAGNFTGVDGFVDLKCKKCGAVITRSFVSVKHGTASCDECKQREIEWARAERERLRRIEVEAKRKEKARQKRLSFKAIQMEMRMCCVCGALFMSTRPNMKYCSIDCQHQNKWRIKDGYRHLFPLEEVYERDNGVCYLCGKPCDWNDYEERDGVIVYGNNYPSRDHVVPKSMGGANDWQNIRLAHRICNSLKADSPFIEKTG